MNDSQFSIEPFLGTWELDPAQSHANNVRDESGAPPARGQYQLIQEPERVAVVMD